MRRFLNRVIGHPLLITLAILAVCALGLYSSFQMPVDLFPEMNVPLVNIVTQFPGAAPNDAELLVTRPIEDAMRGIQGVERVASQSFVGLSVVTVQFTWGTPLAEARQLVTAPLARVRGQLPMGVEPRVAYLGMTLLQVQGYVLYGAGDPVELKNDAQYELASRLMGIAGVGSVEVMGGEDPAYVIEARPELLSALHLSVNRLSSILQENNFSRLEGFMDRSSKEYLIRGEARLRSIEDVKAIPVANELGQPVLLGQVASVKEWRAPKHYAVEANCVPAVALLIFKQPGASTLKVAREVDAAMGSLSGLLPAGARASKFYDQSEIIAKGRTEIFHDLILGAILAVGVLFLFLGRLKPTLVVAFTLPLTLLATLAALHLMGQGLNMITLSALALGVGMFSDDAIVVAENIARHRQLGLGPEEASIEGGAEISGPDASGSFTVVFAFLPLVLVTGLSGVFLRPFGLSVSAGLLASLVLSLTFVPLLMSRVKEAAATERSVGAKLLRHLDEGLQHLLKWAFARRKAVLITSVVLLIASGASLLLIKGFSLLPPIDEGAILIEYRLPHGTALETSVKLGEALSKIALKDPDAKTVYLRVGAPSGTLVSDPINRGELQIKLRDHGRSRSLGAVMDSLRESYSRYPGVVFLYHQPTQEAMDEAFSGLPAFFGVTVFGPDLQVLTKLAADVQSILQRDPSVAAVVNPSEIGAPEIVVRVRYPDLARFNTAAGDVLDAVAAYRYGVEATQILSERRVTGVWIRLSPVERTDPNSIRAIRQLPIPTADGGYVPLDRVADVTVASSPAILTRLNGQREVSLTADVTGSIPGLVTRLNRSFARLNLPKGYAIGYSGEYKTIVKMGLEILFAMVLAVIGIYFIMVIQFGSWKQPLVVLAAVPFALGGAMVALAVARQPIDVSVGMGLMTLIGICVNNAIVLVEYSNRAERGGLERREALLHAASVRLRPILMTALVTLFALLPAAIVAPSGSRIFQPFAVTLLGGLFTAALATLVLVPVLAAGRSPAEKSTAD